MSLKLYQNVIILKYENVASKAMEIVFKWYQTKNAPAKLLIM